MNAAMTRRSLMIGVGFNSRVMAEREVSRAHENPRLTAGVYPDGIIFCLLHCHTRTGCSDSSRSAGS